MTWCNLLLCFPYGITWARCLNYKKYQMGLALWYQRWESSRQCYVNYSLSGPTVMHCWSSHIERVSQSYCQFLLVILPQEQWHWDGGFLNRTANRNTLEFTGSLVLLPVCQTGKLKKDEQWILFKVDWCGGWICAKSFWLGKVGVKNPISSYI